MSPADGRKRPVQEEKEGKTAMYRHFGNDTAILERMNTALHQ
jgi:hypothetical protein